MGETAQLPKATNILPVKERSYMLANPLLLACHQKYHSNRHLSELVPPPMHVRKYLWGYGRDIKQYIIELIDSTSYMVVLNDN